MPQNSRQTINDTGHANVAIARFSAIGDVAMAVPVIYSVCHSYPDIHFVFVTRRTMADIFVNAPANLTVVGIDLKSDYTGVKGMRRLVDELIKDYDINLFVDLHDVLRTRLMRFFCLLRGIRSVNIRKGKSHKHALTRRWHKRMLPLISQRARYRQAFYRAGMPVNDSFEGLYGGHLQADSSIYSAICEDKNESETWVGIAPFAAHKGKIYPPEKMRRVLELLRIDNTNMKFFFFGGGGHERELLEQWAEELGNSVSLAGKRYGFSTELALINHLDIMVTMDSANMHLASISSTPTISIWGATHPYCGFKGWRQSDNDIIQLPMACRPCSVFGSKPCHRGDYMCLNGIKPESVAQIIIKKIAK